MKRMIIIGANGSAYKRTIPALKDSDLCIVTAIQSRNDVKLKSTCKEYNIEKYYIDMDEMLEKEDFDILQNFFGVTNVIKRKKNCGEFVEIKVFILEEKL